MSATSDYPVASQSILRSRRSWVVLLFLIVAAIIAITLYLRPARTYDVNANRKIWLTDVNAALRESGSGGSIAPTGTLRTIAGVGKIQEVFVSKATLRKAVSVLFLTGINQRYAGLAYLEGYPPPPDSCNVHLSGPWWQIAHVNVTTMSCPRGYNFTGGG